MEQIPQKPLKDPDLMNDVIIIVKYQIDKGVKNFYQLSQIMIKEYGEGVRPYLHDAWKMAQEQIKNQSELKAQMLVREGISVKITTRKQRIGIVISLVWMVIVLAFALEELTFSAFLFFGILPVGVGWGIWWIFRTKE